MIVIGITGTSGAGKGVVVEYLQRRCKHNKIESFSMRTMIQKCAYDHYGVFVIDRDNLRKYANRLRKDFGPDILVRTAVDCAERKMDCPVAIIESIRCVGEVNYLVERFGGLFLLLAVDAEQRGRFRRVITRHGATDKVNFEEFCRHESAEIANTSPWEQNLTGCIARADYVIQNNGSEDELHAAVDRFLNKYLPLR